MKDTMMTATEVLDEARRIGAKTALPTLWKYVSLGLLPKGRKIRGRGNAVYFPPDTPQRIRLIQALTEDVGLKLSKVVSIVRNLRGFPKLAAAVSPGRRKQPAKKYSEGHFGKMARIAGETKSKHYGGKDFYTLIRLGYKPSEVTERQREEALPFDFAAEMTHALADTDREISDLQLEEFAAPAKKRARRKK